MYRVIPVVGLSYLLRHVKYISTKLAANKNAHCPLHVQARTHLQPAVDFFARAVVAAEGSDSLTGELLSSVSVTSTILSPLLIDVAGGGSFHEPRECVLSILR